MKISAAVSREAAGAFSIEQLDLEAPRADEVRVRIVATGLCHSDLVVRDQIIPVPLPVVLGHEGAGIIDAIGADVTDFEVGDPVVLGFAACRACEHCQAGEPAYCVDFGPLNFKGARPDDSKSLSDANGPVGSHFFGQSSFANYAVVAARNVVKVPVDAPLELLGPLGCGIMTGAGAVLNALGVGAEHSVLVSGGGPVGLSAVMAAAYVGAETIILVDPIASRRETALDLGATHAISPADGDIATQVRVIVARGADRVLDTSGVAAAIEGAIAVLAPRGKLALVGVPKSLDATFSVPMLAMLQLGATLCGVTEGDADPRDFIPKMIAMHAEGRFPFDRMMKRYPIADINQAVADQREGRCVKVVLTM
jgi:aryl-alcohol dehydrogenase